jgi:hypothetical protein
LCSGVRDVHDTYTQSQLIWCTGGEQGDPAKDAGMSRLDRFRADKDEFFRTDPHSPLTSQQQAEVEVNPELLLDRLETKTNDHIPAACNRLS